MAGFGHLDGGPHSAVVIGAGTVGSSTAWFLQERGALVRTVDRAGATSGNAGRLAPGPAIPLSEPAVLRLFGPAAPPHVPASVNPVTGRLLSEPITTGKQSAALHAPDPLR